MGCQLSTDSIKSAPNPLQLSKLGNTCSRQAIETVAADSAALRKEDGKAVTNRQRSYAYRDGDSSSDASGLDSSRFSENLRAISQECVETEHLRQKLALIEQENAIKSFQDNAVWNPHGTFKCKNPTARSCNTYQLDNVSSDAKQLTAGSLCLDSPSLDEMDANSAAKLLLSGGSCDSLPPPVDCEDLDKRCLWQSPSYAAIIEAVLDADPVAVKAVACMEDFQIERARYRASRSE